MFDPADPSPRPDDRVAHEPVEAWLREWEVQQVQDILAAHPRVGAILEIGVGDGGSLYRWMQAIETGTRVVGVDIVEPPDHLRDWTSMNGMRFSPIVGRSQDPDVIEQVAAWAPFQFIHLDGDHQPSATLLDFEAYRPYLAPGGIIAISNIVVSQSYGSLGMMDVTTDWRNLQARGWLTREIVANPFEPWGGFGLVYP